MNRVDEFHNHHLNQNLKKKKTNKLQGKRSHKQFRHLYEQKIENQNQMYEEIIGKSQNLMILNEKGNLSVKFQL